MTTILRFVSVTTLICVIAGTVAGCRSHEAEWLTVQRERCQAMGGRGAYDPAGKLFECFKLLRTLRVDWSVEIDRKTPGYVKLYEARYTPPPK